MAKKIPAQSVSSSRAARASAPRSGDVAELPYPIIEYAANNSVLYPIDAKAGTKATIAFDGMGSTPITLYWGIKKTEGGGSDLPVFEPIQTTGGADGSVEVDIPWEYVSTCIGHTVLIWYTATQGGQLRQSLVLELEIQHIREADLQGALPVFVHSELEWNTWWLDMHTFQGDETIRVKAWPMIQAGQRLFVTVAGDQHQVPYQFTWVAFDHVVTSAETDPEHVFEFKLSRGWMSRRADYSALTTHMGVIWDQTAPLLPKPDDPAHENPLPINAQDFHLRTTTLLRVDPALDLPPPHLKEAVECGTEGWCVNPVNTVNGGHIVIVYNGMYKGDIVCPKFEGTPGRGSPALECRTVQEGEIRLEFPVPASAISANFGAPITLSYTVSYNGTGPWLSPPGVVNVLDISGLPTPTVEQATGKTLDLNTFSGDADAAVIRWPYIELEQACWLWVTGELEDGTAYSFEVLEGEPVSAQWLASGVNTPLPREELQRLADCRPFQVHFAVNFNGLADKASAKAFPVLSLGIVHEDLVLGAPTVREAVGADLTIWNARHGLTVRVAYERISPHHTINVQWVKADGSSLLLAPKPGNSDPGYVDFAVSREAVIHGAGKTILISYTVSSACKLATSKLLALNISEPVRLPMLVVPQATNGILDLRTFDGDADITVYDENYESAWWFALVGQRVWLRGSGKLENGDAYTINVYLGKVVTVDEVNAGLAGILKRAELELLEDSSALTFTCKVTTDGSTHESEAIEFPLLTLEITKPYKDLTNFDNRDWRGWTRGSGAPDSRDLSLEPQADGFALKNYTYSARNIGPIVQRTFSDLEYGRQYQFSVRVRRYNGANPTPKLSLRKNSVRQTDIKELIDLNWYTLSFIFVADATAVLLEVYSHEEDARRTGNDYLMDDFLIMEI
ncbi:hypothetical protein OOJ96_10320 [Pseudomonas sp. 15FMM2]|uniref:Uncharacterized protein n=1 Tax=Pseudomonas imrae TaxID=2992837 RepID=A0ACC7PCR1_9PSED